MSTDFFFKKKFTYALALLFGLFMMTLYLCTVYFQGAEKVVVFLRYYYLVQEDVYTEAGAITVYQEGGASYLLQENNKQYVALSVYTNEQDAQIVCAGLSDKDKAVFVIEKRVDALYFKSKKEKELSNRYVDGIQSFDACIRVLEQCIYNLDNGMSQEKSKESLRLLNRQLKYMWEAYRSNFNALSKACFGAWEGLSTICNSLIMANDLRYLLCEMAEQNVSLAEDFAL